MKSAALVLLTTLGTITVTACDGAIQQQLQSLPQPQSPQAQEPLPVQGEAQQTRRMTPLCDGEWGPVVCVIQ